MTGDNLFESKSEVGLHERESLAGGPGSAIWFTGLSGSGKTTLARRLERRFVDSGRLAYLLDGDNIRRGLNRDLGFTARDRTENIRRIGELCRLFVDAGVTVIAAFISPYREDRGAARSLLPPGRFFEIHVATSLEVCRNRDVKGLYAKALNGNLDNFTGISAPYEPPVDPELTIDTARRTVEECVETIHRSLEKRNLFV